MRKLILLTFVLIAVTACKKKSTDTTVSLDVTMANIAGTYKITAATATQSGITVDVYNNASVFPPCNKDDIYVFSASGTYTITDAGVTCSPPSNFSGTYSVNTSAKTITLNGQVCNVISLTSSAAVVAQPNFMGSSATVTATYTRQ